MAIALPNFDDRRWSEMVDEGRALIPFYAPEWTDHNIHDPGITVLELFAWVAEQDIYRLNRIADSHRRKFLALVGVRPEPPRPAFTVIAVTPKPGASVRIPQSVEFEAAGPAPEKTRFRTLEAMTAADVHLDAVQLHDERGFHDLTRRFQRDERIAIFGENPRPGFEFYLGFRDPLPVNHAVSLFFLLDDLDKNHKERERYSQEPTRLGICKCSSALIGWEYLDAAGHWEALTAPAEINDGTDGLHWNGRVSITVPAATAKEAIGAIESELFYLRLHLAAGMFDAAPVLQRLIVNGVLAEQAVPAGILKWRIAQNAVIEGSQPKPGETTRFHFQLDGSGEIVRLVFDSSTGDENPSFRVLEFQPDTGTPGVFSIEAERLGRGSGRPEQRVSVSGRPVLESSFRLFTIEAGSWHEWTRRPDLDSSGRGDAHFLLDDMAGIVTFGNGDSGRVVPENAPIIAAYQTTRAQIGNVGAGQIAQISDSPHNHAVPEFDLDDAKARIGNITNSVAAIAGTAEETLSQAEGRAAEIAGKTQRAVTIADYEALALETPGVRLARVTARANLHPAFPCMQAPGVITLIVLPYLPVGRPLPGSCALRAVAAYVGRRRIIGARLEVVGPTYTEVTVQASVKPLPGSRTSVLQQRVADALNAFFDPIAGGPERTGWPFGRSIYRSEVLQVIDQVPGVDHVISLALMADGDNPQCGNLCIGSTGLVASGKHQILIEGAAHVCR